MRQSLKIAISLLASLLLFAGFAVVAFAGLFDFVQASFFLPRVQEGYREEVQTLATRIDTFHEANLERFGVVVGKDFAQATLGTSLSPVAVQQWASTLSTLNILSVRVLSGDGSRILFSSLQGDVRSQDATRVAYRNYNEVGESIPADRLTLRQGEAAKVLVDGDHGRFLYVLPGDAAGHGTRPEDRGTAVFAVGAVDLLNDLQLTSQVPVTRVSLVGADGVLLNFPVAEPGPLNARLQSVWRSHTGEASFMDAINLTGADGATQGFTIFSLRLKQGGTASLVVMASAFAMSDLMKGLLLATFFCTVFLILYLLLNLRSDPLEVLRQRVKRFQIQLIGEMVDRPAGRSGASCAARWRQGGTRSPGTSSAGSEGSPASRSR